MWLVGCCTKKLSEHFVTGGSANSKHLLKLIWNKITRVSNRWKDYDYTYFYIKSEQARQLQGMTGGSIWLVCSVFIYLSNILYHVLFLHQQEWGRTMPLGNAKVFYTVIPCLLRQQFIKVFFTSSLIKELFKKIT